MTDRMVKMYAWMSAISTSKRKMPIRNNVEPSVGRTDCQGWAKT